MHDFARAFVEGAVVGKAPLRPVIIGELEVPTGAIVACDPLVFPETSPFTRALPRGRHRVVLSIAHLGDGDERAAFAAVRVSDVPVARWEPALLPGQDASELGEGELFGYGVDAGLGCFMDVEAQRLLLSRMESLGDGNYFDEVLDDELQENSHPSWDWCLHRPRETSSLNVAVFSSGLGDGVYGSCFGLDANGGVVWLVTDFGVVDLAER